MSEYAYYVVLLNLHTQSYITGEAIVRGIISDVETIKEVKEGILDSFGIKSKDDWLVVNFILLRAVDGQRK